RLRLSRAHDSARIRASFSGGKVTGLVARASAAFLTAAAFRPRRSDADVVASGQTAHRRVILRRLTATRRASEREEGTMPLYLSRFSYTPQTWARLIGNPEDRRK